MPDITISLTTAQAQEVAAALGVSSAPEARVKVVEWLRAMVKDHRYRVAAQVAQPNVDAVDTDFSGI